MTRFTSRLPLSLYCRKFFAVAAVLVAFSIITAAVLAAPVTLWFEGAIGPPRDGTSPVDLPFSFAEGDPINGTVTFEPVDVASDVERTTVLQNFPLEFHFNSVTLRTPSYRIFVTDDAVSDEDPTPRDRIVLDCVGASASGACQTPLPDAPHIQWSFGWTVGGGGDHLPLDGADIPELPGPWNQLTPNSLLISFLDTSIGRGTGFEATINSFQIVPEPTTLVLLAVTCSLPVFLPLRINRCGR
jgi:hypothetical protein